MKKLKTLAAAALGLALAASGAATAAPTIKTVVLVHGAWADGASWSKVIPLLTAAGLSVTAVQLPLTSLEDDVATVKRALARTDGPVVLVGHSYGGVVITEAGTDPKVARLVYVAAFAPDAGQSLGSLGASAPPAPMNNEAKPDALGFLSISKTGIEDDFAQDLSPSEKLVLYSAQAPTNAKAFGEAVTTPAWKTRPSRYVVAAHDRAINPDLERTMARTLHAHTVELPTSHVAMLADPRAVARVIEEAAQ